jgi:hypothetical protein
VTLRVACGDDEVRIVFSWAVAFVVGDREAKALILKIAHNVRSIVEEVSELFLEIGMAWHLVRVAPLAFPDDAGPLESPRLP